MKKKKYQPWLTPTGVEIPTEDLKKISKSWNRNIWEQYLSWYEKGRKESLIHPSSYQIIGDEQTETIFEQFSQNSSQENRDQCENVLALLPPLEAAVLRYCLIEGRTEIDVGSILKRSRTGINHIKNRALSRLKRGNSGEGWSARRIMRGEEYPVLSDEPSIWDEPLEYPIKEDRIYDPENYKAEFKKIKTLSIRDALMALPERAAHILYLRYWCDFSLSRTAKFFGVGTNVTQQIEEASIFKVKQRAIENEINSRIGGVL